MNSRSSLRGSLVFGWLLAACGSLSAVVSAQDSETESAEAQDPWKSSTFSALKFRGVGPAIASGRIGDFAVHPDDFSTYYVATCSGGVWKTTNGGTTYEPIFDGEGSYSIGCVTLDPQNPNVVWVGTGENNSQRSVSFGDGLYKSVDGGKSWKHVGLKDSEHIGMILVHPEDSNVVYVAAQGPLWRSGGDRGLYQTTDGGETWNKILDISENTGVNEIHMDPRDPHRLYCSSYQRRRRTWTLLNGGPESTIYKSEDGGASWRKSDKGLPSVDKGRIGMAISPANPDVVYAICEAAKGEGGFFRSVDRGETWEKQSDKVASSPQYYNEIFADPVNVDLVYLPDTYTSFTDDGGKTFQRLGGDHRHVDDHALWINPHDTDHLLIGGDGGIYESFNRGGHWHFKENLPITQFYRVTVDNSEPFYFIYGGTQDNNTLGGPSRTLSRGGIANEDWFVTVGGDGFETQVDPVDPNTVYSQWQYGGLVRYDRKSGEIFDVKPREAPGEDPNRWNWDSPLLISPHSPTRLYFASQRVYRSDDRGHSWKAISGDLTKNIDRNKLEIMGKVWSVDAVSKNRSTSPYGNIVSFSESPRVEGLLYVGTDDGLIQVSADGGGSWTQYDSFPGVPDSSYVSCLQASRHDDNAVYATFDNHKSGDFKPYILKSTDRGQSWTSIASDLPERDICWVVQEDHELDRLLFLGTEFGCYFSPNGGDRWIALKAGLPTIAVRDIDIQRRENDLVLGTLGRSFYVLDDYSPLRDFDEATLESDVKLFAVKNALQYVENSRLGLNSGIGFQGGSFYTAPNPHFGAVFTYYLKDTYKTREEIRHEAESELEKDGQSVNYPSWDELRLEDEERDPEVWAVVKDAKGQVVRRVKASRKAGTHRVAWDLRYPSSTPVVVGGRAAPGLFSSPDVGPMALPGTYSVTLQLIKDGEVSNLAGPESFEVTALNQATFRAEDVNAVQEFRMQVAELQRAVTSTSKVMGETRTRLDHIRTAIKETPGADPAWLTRLEGLVATWNGLSRELSGDRTISSRSEPTPPSIQSRVGIIVGNQWNTTSAPTQTERDGYRYAGEALEKVLGRLKKLVTEEIPVLEKELDRVGAPYTPGRLPDWKMN